MMSCLSLPKKWGWPVCLVWGPGSCIRGSGLRACAFQGEQQSGTLLHPRDRPGQKVQKGKLSPESPSQTGAISPTCRENSPQMGEFPSDKSSNKSGLALTSWCSCPNTWSGLMFQSQGQNPWEGPAHTGYCQGNQTDWAHKEFACKETGKLK